MTWPGPTPSGTPARMEAPVGLVKVNSLPATACGGTVTRMSCCSEPLGMRTVVKAEEAQTHGTSPHTQSATESIPNVSRSLSPSLLFASLGPHPSLAPRSAFCFAPSALCLCFASSSTVRAPITAFCFAFSNEPSRRAAPRLSSSTAARSSRTPRSPGRKPSSSDPTSAMIGFLIGEEGVSIEERLTEPPAGSSPGAFGR
mmetsp:Transcript_29463/g.94276  ORF Transcript_29463/g.94276 Transcript_29463/m.94276 type:complete len:200 (-) Transcript_29463:11-610(-)